MREESPTPHSFGLGTDFNPGPVAGSASAKLQPAGGIVVPATPTPSSASGCAASDFTGFTAGNIALIQRGTCTFAEKVANAEAAGASGVVIFNEGNPGRTSLFSGSLSGDEHIPVLFTSYAVGTQLLGQYSPGTGPVLTIDVKAIDDPNRSDWNVIADSKGGDPNNILVIDAHLDAIYGAGMLDNASGSAAILDIGQQLKNTNTRNKLRFIWFGGEELGLLGSHHYVDTLPADQLAKIKFDLDADVLATPNYVAGVLDPKDGVQLLRPHPRNADATQHLCPVGDRPRLRDRLPQLDREEPHPLLGRRHRRLRLPAGGDPRQRCHHRTGLLQARLGRQPVRRL